MKPYDAADKVAVQNTGDSASSLIDMILSRRSVSPKWQGQPEPTASEIKKMIGAAITAPDHDGLRPWRFLAIRGAVREKLADVFAEAKRIRSPEENDDEIEQERDRGRKAPLTLAVITCPVLDNLKVPVRDQYVSVGAAIQNILLTCHAMGFGAKTMSGVKVLDACVLNALGVKPDEELVAFICIGTPQAPPKKRPRPRVEDHFAEWTGEDSKS